DSGVVLMGAPLANHHLAHEWVSETLTLWEHSVRARDGRPDSGDQAVLVSRIAATDREGRENECRGERRRSTSGRRKQGRAPFGVRHRGGQRLVVAQMPSFGSAPAFGGSSMDSGSSTTIPSALIPRRKSMPGLRNALASGFGPILESGPSTGARSGMILKNCSRSM